MRVLLVRHAESTFNRTRRFPTKDVPLSERGKIEAHLTAQRIKDTFPAQALMASDLWRAQQTAKIIESVIGIPAEYSDALREVRRPSSILGKSVFHPQSLWANARVLMGAHNPAFHYTDAETITQARERAQSALNHLIARPESHIVVVSHEMFIKAMLESMTIARDARGMTAYRLFRPFLILRNASLTECVWDGSWHIRYVNQTRHLRRQDVSLIPR